MNNSFTSFLIIIITFSLNTFAESLNCYIRPMKALSSGIVPEDNNKLINLSVNIMTLDAIKDSANPTELCSSSTVGDKKIELCAFESDFSGGYNININVYETGFEKPTLSEYLVATSRKNGLGLIRHKDLVLSSVYNKLSHFNVEIPESTEGDLTLLDIAIRTAYTRGLIKKNEVIFYALDIERGCTFSKEAAQPPVITPEPAPVTPPATPATPDNGSGSLPLPILPNQPSSPDLPTSPGLPSLPVNPSLPPIGNK